MYNFSRAPTVSSLLLRKSSLTRDWKKCANIIPWLKKNVEFFHLTMYPIKNEFGLSCLSFSLLTFLSPWWVSQASFSFHSSSLSNSKFTEITISTAQTTLYSLFLSSLVSQLQKFDFMANETKGLDALDPLARFSVLSLFPRTLGGLQTSPQPSDLEQNLDLLHGHVKSLVRFCFTPLRTSIGFCYSIQCTVVLMVFNLRWLRIFCYVDIALTCRLLDFEF